MKTGWEQFFGGGGLYSQSQQSPMGGLERLLYLLQTRGQDSAMRGMWGDQGQRMPRDVESQDMWKEMLQRQMWQQIYQQPSRDMMGRQRMQPMNSVMIGRRG